MKDKQKERIKLLEEEIKEILNEAEYNNPIRPYRMRDRGPMPPPYRGGGGVPPPRPFPSPGGEPEPVPIRGGRPDPDYGARPIRARRIRRVRPYEDQGYDYDRSPREDSYEEYDYDRRRSYEDDYDYPPPLRRRRRIGKRDAAPWFANDTGVPQDETRRITTRIQQIKAELETYKGTELEYSDRAQTLQNELDSLTGSGTWSKIRQSCRMNPKLCAFLGISAGVLGYFGLKKAGQAMGYIAPDAPPSPTPGPTPSPGGRGGRYVSCQDNLLKRSCMGENVKKLQNDLIKLGYTLQKHGEDGKFGPETQAAVKKFQTDAGLKADGIAGAQTLAKIQELLMGKKQAPQAPVATTTITPPSSTPGPKPEKIEAFQENYYIKPIRTRNENVENIIFEKLVKNANRLS